jgi:uncharacterized protein
LIWFRRPEPDHERSEPLPVRSRRDSDRHDVVIAAATIHVRVRAASSRDELIHLDDGTIVVRVAAPPLDGRANKAVCRLIAKQVGVPPSRVTILRGARSREKTLSIEGVDQAAANAALKI